MARPRCWSGLLGRHEEALATLEVVLPQLQNRKLPAWNIAQAQLGIARALKALRREGPRTTMLAGQVAGMKGEEHAEQRSEAEALLK